jgi:hypothetical protein
MNMPRYRTFDDFTREHIRPGLKAGWSFEDLNESGTGDSDFDVDPFEAALRAADYEEEPEDAAHR